MKISSLLYEERVKKKMVWNQIKGYFCLYTRSINYYLRIHNFPVLVDPLPKALLDP